MKNLLKTSAVLSLIVFCNIHTYIAKAQGTAFTYQGQLLDGGSPANGSFDLRFDIYTQATGGSIYAGPLTNLDTTISNGLFTVVLDFGSGVFTGGSNWMRISARTNGAINFTALSPRQQLTADPYAIFAESASNLTGTISLNQLPGDLVTNDATGVNLTGKFFGNGAGLTNVNATTLGGMGAGTFWQLGGNNVAGGQFIGSTNNQPVEIWAGGQRAMRFEPFSFGAPNVIGGASVNYVSNGVYGATIAGGGVDNFFGSAISNSVMNYFGTVGGGAGNTSSGNESTVSGGVNNTASGDFSLVGAGNGNSATGQYATLMGGGGNSSAGQYSTLAGGDANIANGSYDTIGGGIQNSAGRNYSFIGGGAGNTSSGIGAVVAGGETNFASGPATTVGGGLNNSSTAANTTIAGGNGNSSSANSAAVGGGSDNTASGTFSVVSGGEGNTANANQSFVGGGADNLASGVEAVVGGGIFNAASGGNSTIGGGIFNVASNSYATVAGGDENIAGGQYSAVVGGGFNVATNSYSFIGGGYDNEAVGSESMIGGGEGNLTIGIGSTVSGGVNNIAQYGYDTVGGGTGNEAEGGYSTIPGGYENYAPGLYSFAAGNEAEALYQGDFVWGDSQNTPVESTGTDQFIIRAQGGVGINEVNPTGDSLSIGGSTRLNNSPIYLRAFPDQNHGLSYVGNGTSFAGISPDGPVLWGYTSGILGTAQNATAHASLQWDSTSVTVNGTFNNNSDRNAKQDFSPVDTAGVLDKVAKMPITKWHYKADAATPHMGPMAQDFFAAFNVGTDEKHIAPIDEGGVALAAIQGLNQKLDAKDAKIEEQAGEIAELKGRLERLEQLMSRQSEAGR